MAILGKEKRIAEHWEEDLDTTVTKASFEKRFRSYTPAAHLQAEVGEENLGFLFKIVDEFRRVRIATKAAKKQRLLQDYEACLKLIEGTNSRMDELLGFVERFPKDAASLRTAPVVEFILKVIGPAKKILEKTLDETYFDVDNNLSMLVDLHPKTEVNELMVNLETFMSAAYPKRKMKEKDRNALIGAALAGVGLLSEDEPDADPQERIPMKVSRAKKHYKEKYQDQGIARVFPVLLTGRTENKALEGRRKKKKRMVAAQKKRSMLPQS